MPAKIPRPIRNEVITKWLSGVGRDKIAKDCGISTGMVSNITSSERTQGNFSPEDFDLIRQTALKLKQEGLSLDKLVSPLRLHSIIKNKNLKEEQVERLIEALDVHFFKKKGALTEEFTDDIIKLSEMSNYYFASDTTAQRSLIAGIESTTESSRELGLSLDAAEEERIVQ
jgi:hypothetical protein